MKDKFLKFWDSNVFWVDCIVCGFIGFLLASYILGLSEVYAFGFVGICLLYQLASNQDKLSAKLDKIMEANNIKKDEEDGE